MIFKRTLCFVLCLCALVFTGAPAQTVGDENAPAPIGKLVDIGGYKLHAIVSGSKSPIVVFIAGAGDYSFDWSLVQPSVSNLAMTLSYDRAGSGWSDLGPTPRTMKQEAYELHLLLAKLGINSKIVLVGHSIGGLIARVNARLYPAEIAGVVLVDSTDEDTTLMYQGKLVHIRQTARSIPVPPVQTLATSPLKPPSEDDKKQAMLNLQVFGPPKIEPPFDKLSPDLQKITLWFDGHPKVAASSDDFWPEELQEMYVDRMKNPCPLGDIPLEVLIAGRQEQRPPDVTEGDWKTMLSDKRAAKLSLANLSRNSKVIVDNRSGHHIQLDDPELVIKSIQEVLDSARRHKPLSEEKLLNGLR